MRALIALLTAALATAAWGDGIIIPEPPFPDLAIKYHRVEVEIGDQTAHTQIDQVFLNRQQRDIEGTYIFPLPRDASVSAFTMHVDGEPLTAEILQADEARQIYEEIVRQRIDPALLEYVGQGAYRARIFPIPAEGEKRIELAYDEILRQDANIVRYTYPLNTEKFSAEPLEDVSVTVNIHSTTPIKAIYSPSHEIAIERNGELAAKVIYADEGIIPDKDFVLYYSVDPEEVGLSLLTYTAPDEERGFYMLLAAPQVELETDQVIPKRMIFALDRSGSMAGEKMEQARAALRFAVNSLDAGDLVNIVDYATTVETFADSAVAITAQSRADLLAYIDAIEASGGTYIHGALLKTLEMLRGDERAEMVVFLTDGKPTIGERDTEQILLDVTQNNSSAARLFVFGVGHEVNTHLLDRLSAQNGGTSSYIEPQEDIELAVSSFYTKVSNPVLEDLEVEFFDARVSDAYPPALPNLFRGAQIVQLGRLEAAGSLTVALSGQVQQRRATFQRQIDTATNGPEFLPRLWATRKVGFLLDEIRLHGEEQELVDSIVALSRRYGIITPYTSFLIVEDEPLEPTIADDSFRAESGADAIASSEAVRSYAEADNATQIRSEELRYVGDKTFFLRDGYWRDSQYDETKPANDYVFGTDAYFTLIAQEPELGRYLSLGPFVLLSFNGENIRIGENTTRVNQIQSPSLPQEINLEQNFPNPFNSGTEIRFSLATAGQAELTIYNLVGQEIATLIDAQLPAGPHIAVWNGRNNTGKDLATGVYFYRLIAGDKLEHRKLVLLR